MRNRIKAFAVAGGLAIAGAVGTSASASTEWDIGTIPEPCWFAVTRGPNGWWEAKTRCTAPMQAHDKMQRVRVTMARGFEVEVRYGNWVDCNNTYSEIEPFHEDNWDSAVLGVVYVNDAKPGGC